MTKKEIHLSGADLRIGRQMVMSVKEGSDGRNS